MEGEGFSGNEIHPPSGTSGCSRTDRTGEIDVSVQRMSGLQTDPSQER